MARSTYTYAILELPEEMHAYIKEKLLSAGYDHAIHEDDGKTVLDMHGIGIGVDKSAPPKLYVGFDRDHFEQLLLRQFGTEMRWVVQVGPTGYALGKSLDFKGNEVWVTAQFDIAKLRTAQSIELQGPSLGTDRTTYFIREPADPCRSTS